MVSCHLCSYWKIYYQKQKKTTAFVSFRKEHGSSEFRFVDLWKGFARNTEPTPQTEKDNWTLYWTESVRTAALQATKCCKKIAITNLCQEERKRPALGEVPPGQSSKVCVSVTTRRPPPGCKLFKSYPKGGGPVNAGVASLLAIPQELNKAAVKKPLMWPCGSEFTHWKTCIFKHTTLFLDQGLEEKSCDYQPRWRMTMYNPCIHGLTGYPTGRGGGN